MRHVKIGYLLIGLGLLGLILHETDLQEVWHHVRQVGWGAVLILTVYAAAFLFDVAAWRQTFAGRQFTAIWGGLFQLWKVRMVGESFNQITPLATMGGEPIKALLLKNHYGVGYREGIASIVLVKTCFLIAMTAFLGIGVLFAFDSERLSATYNWFAALGLFLFAFGIGLIFVIQRSRFSTRAANRLFAKRLHGRLASALIRIAELEDQLVSFYTRDKRHFAATVSLCFGNWMLGTLELYVTLWVLGHPVTFEEAWVIEAVAQLVRSITFFIPASIGAQEGGIVVICAVMTGSPTLGLAVSVLRRARELIWIIGGLVVAWIYSFQRSRNEMDQATAPRRTASS